MIGHGVQHREAESQLEPASLGDLGSICALRGSSESREDCDRPSLKSVERHMRVPCRGAAVGCMRAGIRQLVSVTMWGVVEPR